MSQRLLESKSSVVIAAYAPCILHTSPNMIPIWWVPHYSIDTSTFGWEWFSDTLRQIELWLDFTAHPLICMPDRLLIFSHYRLRFLPSSFVLMSFSADLRARQWYPYKPGSAYQALFRCVSVSGNNIRYRLFSSVIWRWILWIGRWRLANSSSWPFLYSHWSTSPWLHTITSSSRIR